MAGQVWDTDNLGGFMGSAFLSDLLRNAVQPMNRFRQFSDAKDASKKGLHDGDTFNWNVYSKVQTAGTVLTEGSAMPVTNYVITQGTLSVNEYGNSVPFSSKLDDMSKQPVSEIIHKVLKNDANNALDTAAYNEFNKTPILAVGTAAATIVWDVDGTTTQVNASALLNAHVKLISDEMKERNIPAYDGRDYFCIGRPATFRGFKDDLESIHSYTAEGFQLLMNGEIGRHYEGIRFVEQTNIATESWSGGSDAAFFFGEDTVAEAIVILEEMRGKIPDDYGRGKGVAWYYLGGFGLVHTLTMGEAQSRIIKWDSAS